MAEIAGHLAGAHRRAPGTSERDPGPLQHRKAHGPAIEHVPVPYPDTAT